ncbi:hypothetical protein T440DRAFT_468449 [Plenodomus tracheiphilus IPT5]|uniref:Uncharacterized protein n=1 Tax=Plenodomus tracheiphilus IPT5 TaxID=1408161 RepID=A0A6A7B4K8_9PLEO|nr:hypothetical protein T440DRAFT_468449 [Plenodomus tracheiphilus IPT5]
MNANKLLSYALQPQRLQNLHNTIRPLTKPALITSRTMATSTPNPTSPNTAGPDSEQHPPSQTPEQQQEQSKTPLPLPSPSTTDPDSDTTKLDMSTGANTVKLDHMGPLVVNKDGTLSRIANWDTMAEIERQNTLRILGKRNMLRREGLERARQAEGGKEGE